jgi:hypothetical protein
MVDYGERTTGTRDAHYNLVSVLYHALSGADTCERYALDAETVGDERLAAFFRETQVMQSQIAERAKGLLGIPEPLPEFGTSPATGTTPAGGSTSDMPRSPLRDAPSDVERGTVSDAPIVPPEEGVPPYVASPPGGESPSREESPPGEERPERRGSTTPPTPREEPPPGEERPGRRNPP